MTTTIIEEKEGVKEGVFIVPEPDVIDETGEVILPEIKGLEILKEGTYAVDLEKTISDMLLVIKKMEAQLDSVLKLNDDLEKDLDTSKESIAGLREEKSQLGAKIARMEEEIPSKRELQIENNYLIEERNDVQHIIREMKTKIENMKKEAVRYQKKISGLREDKKDIRIEIDYLQSKLNSVLEKNKYYQTEIDALRGEKLTQEEKIKSLEKELKETLKEKYRLYQEIKVISQ